MRDALRKLELFVVSENVMSNDTVDAGAHVRLPAAAWGEKDGTVTNSERRITRQRAFLPVPGEAKPDWWMVAEVARRMGFGAGFAYRSAADVFREHAALSGFENAGTRDFDIGGLAGISDTDYETLAPTQWPLRAGETAPQARFFADGGYFTPNRKARFIAPEMPAPKVPNTRDYPFRLNTGRVRDQWHTMTRSGMSPRLALHCVEPFVEVHPEDADAAGLSAGGFARVATRHGEAILKVVVSDGQRPGSLFVPIHWSDATASMARVGDLVGPATDPHSGQPEAKATPAAIAPAAFVSRGFALTRGRVTWPPGTWWARVAVTAGSGYWLATNDPPATWQQTARRILGERAELAEYVDAPRGLYRAAAFAEGRLDGCIFIGPSEAAPQWDAVRDLFGSEAIAPAQRRMLLSGKSAGSLPDAGPLICSCFGVGLNVIRGALRSGAAANVEDIGKALRAGTNCGSCLPELKRIVQGSANERVAAV